MAECKLKLIEVLLAYTKETLKTFNKTLMKVGFFENTIYFVTVFRFVFIDAHVHVKIQVIYILCRAYNMYFVISTKLVRIWDLFTYMSKKLCLFRTDQIVI